LDAPSCRRRSGRPGGTAHAGRRRAARGGRVRRTLRPAGPQPAPASAPAAAAAAGTRRGTTAASSARPASLRVTARQPRWTSPKNRRRSRDFAKRIVAVQDRCACGAPCVSVRRRPLLPCPAQQPWLLQRPPREQAHLRHPRRPGLPFTRKRSPKASIPTRTPPLDIQWVLSFGGVFCPFLFLSLS
jgi:hypothetical protein